MIIKQRISIFAFLVIRLTTAFISPNQIGQQQRQIATPLPLNVVSLKPAAIPLMDSGKAFARSGEFLIDVTSKIELYGGALSAAGALIRNSGDCLAQAGASSRFKTGLELVCDELREAATCLDEATSKLELAAREANADDNERLGGLLEESIPTIAGMATTLEAAGCAILQGKTEKEVGENFLKCSEYMETFTAQVKSYAPELDESSNAGQRMELAHELMRNAASKLTGDPPKSIKPKGKAWIKG
mmetsp:Transcript_29866/g.45255  ORF Transcript_29866/g.45255 Transcript_29866/m.45255 type:complete len:245 (+) Transcript_29866:138-872(+)